MCVGELEIGHSSSQCDGLQQTSGSKGGWDADTVCSTKTQVIYICMSYVAASTSGYSDVFF